jgi:tellurite resistance protein TerB
MPIGWLSALKNAASDTMIDLDRAVKRYNNKNFANATMAISAGVTAADGKVENTERQKNVVAVKTNSLLKVFDATQLVNSYNKFLDAFEADLMLGEMEIEPVIKALTDPDQQDKALRIGIMLAKSDDEFADSERDFLRKVCGWWGLSPQTYGL